MIPHTRPTTPTGSEWEEVTSLLADGWVADGPCVRTFEKEAASWMGQPEGIAVGSGTSALHLALLAVGAGPGKEVLIPAYACAALLCAVDAAGAQAVLVDCEPGEYWMDVDAARSAITPSTVALVLVHPFGRAAPVAPFLQLGPVVIEDCAQSLGARRGGIPTGSAAEIAIGSFYATKVITTGQGGLVATGDSAAAAHVRDLLEYDQREDYRLRFNSRMPELSAALGRWQLARLPRLLQRRREIADRYRTALQGFRLPVPTGDEEPIDFRFVMRVPRAVEAIDQLRAQGVGARQPVYRPLHRYLGGQFPHADAAQDQTISLPIYPALTDHEVGRVIAAVRELPQKASQG